MQEQVLLKIALATSIIGIIVLFIISKTVKIDETMINHLDGLADNTVIITGSVLGVDQKNSTTFLRVSKDEVTSVILFGKVPVIESGDYVQVRGKVTEQDGKSEIIGEEVRVI